MQNKGRGPIRQSHRLDMLYPLMQITKNILVFFHPLMQSHQTSFFLEIWFSLGVCPLGQDIRCKLHPTTKHTLSCSPSLMITEVARKSFKKLFYLSECDTKNKSDYWIIIYYVLSSGSCLPSPWHRRWQERLKKFSNLSACDIEVKLVNSLMLN